MIKCLNPLYASPFKEVSKIKAVGTSHMLLAVMTVVLFSIPSCSYGFWLLSFSSADTLPPGEKIVFAGTGGIFSQVGEPAKNSFSPFLPHAGFKIGVTDRIETAYRLSQVTVPFSSVGPSLGGELDARYRLTPYDAPWQVSILDGVSYSYLEILDSSRNAWSNGADLLVSHALNEKYTFISELRYVYTAIPSAPGGSSDNHLNAAGVGIGLKYALTRTISLVPEIGVFDFSGHLLGDNADGFAIQYGLCAVFRF